MTCGCPPRRTIAGVRGVIISVKQANMLAPSTSLAPIHLTNAAMGETALRGLSFVQRGSVHRKSAIVVCGTNRVVPRVTTILGRGEGNDRGRFRVPRGYPMYKGPVQEVSARTTFHYVGPTYNNIIHRGLVRFTSHSTVSVRNLNPTIMSDLLTCQLITSTTSFCTLGRSSLQRVRQVNRGDTTGLVATVHTDGRQKLTGLLFNLKVHFLKRGNDRLTTRCFRAVSTVVTTSIRAVRRARKVNGVATGDLCSCFRSRGGVRVVGGLGGTNILVRRVGRRSRDKVFSKRSIMLAKGLTIVKEHRTSSLVGHLKKAARDSIAGAAALIITKRSTKDGLRGTETGNVPIVSRRRFLGHTKIKVGRWAMSRLMYCGCNMFVIVGDGKISL